MKTKSTKERTTFINPNPFEELLSSALPVKKKNALLQTVLGDEKITTKLQALCDLLKDNLPERRRAFEYIAKYYAEGTTDLICFEWRWELIHEFQPYVGDLFEQRNYIGNLYSHLKTGGGYGGSFPIPRMGSTYTVLKVTWQSLLSKIAQFYNARKNDIVGDKDPNNLTIAEYIETLCTNISDPRVEITLDEHYNKLSNDDRRYEFVKSILIEVDYTLTEKHLAAWNWANVKKARLEPSIISEAIFKKLENGPTTEKVTEMPQFFGIAWLGTDEESVMAPIFKLALFELKNDGKIYWTSRQGNLGWMISKFNELLYIDQEILLKELPQRIIFQSDSGKEVICTKGKLMKIISKANSGDLDHSMKLQEFLETLKPRDSKKSLRN